MLKKMILLCLLTALSISAHGQQSLYSDIKAHRPGDVITVILTENISGSSSTDASSQSNTSGTAESSVSGNFLPFEPVFGADASVDYNADERITANQQQLLQGTLSVRVDSVTQSGNLLVKGKRSTEINGELHRMEITGLVRPSDVTDANEVLSYRIADANITYLKKGGLRETRNKTGIGRKIIWAVVGVATGAAVILMK
jgi:flagellar L-ring protein precursor FlgH